MDESEARQLIAEISAEKKTKLKDPEFQSSLQVISEIWGKPEHAIIELLQNADDAEAGKVRLTIDRTQLIFSHNGMVFDSKDVRSICSSALSTKKAGSHIGFLGIGFKSVFQLSDNPRIFSGPFAFAFSQETKIVPEWIEKRSEEPQDSKRVLGTSFILPFQNNLPPSVVDDLKQFALKELSPVSLAFLRHVRHIDMKVDSVTRIMRSKELSCSGKQPTVSRMQIKETNVDNSAPDGKKSDKTLDLVVFETTKQVPENIKKGRDAQTSGRASLKELVVSIAFLLDDRQNLTPMEGCLFTFVPTTIATGLKFIINADFIVNSPRDDIKWGSGWNRWLLESTSRLLNDAVEWFKKSKDFRHDFYRVLPVAHDVVEHYREPLVTPFYSYCREHPIVLTSTGSWARPSEAAFASSGFQRLFPARLSAFDHYVHPDIKSRAFLKEVGAQEIDETNAIAKLLDNHDFLASRSARWFRGLYSYLFTALYGEQGWKLNDWLRDRHERQLKEIPFVRCSSGQLIRPEEAVLPPSDEEESGFGAVLLALHMVDKATLNEDGSGLLGRLGVRRFSEEAVVRQVLKDAKAGLSASWSTRDKTRALTFLSRWFAAHTWTADMQPYLQHVLVPTDKGWRRAGESYLSNRTLRRVVGGRPFAAAAMVRKMLGIKWREFLSSIGVLDCPRIIVFENRYSRNYPPEGIDKEDWYEYWRTMPTNATTSEKNVDDPCTLDGFLQALKSRRTEVLREYLKYLTTHWERYYSQFATCTLNYFYYQSHQSTVPAFFHYMLQTAQWIPTTQGYRVPSCDLFAPSIELRRLAGPFVEYVLIPENLAHKASAFLATLGITVEVNRQTIRYLLEKIKDAKVGSESKRVLGRIYRVAVSLDKEAEPLEASLLAEGEEFVASNRLFWGDDPGLATLLKGKVALAWEPRDLTRHELEEAFDFFGVRRLSSVAERQIILGREKPVVSEEWVKRFHERTDLVYSVFSNFQADKLSELSSFLSSNRIFITSPVRIQVSFFGKTFAATAEVYFDQDSHALWHQPSARTEDFAIELTRAFGLPLDCAQHVRSALGQDYQEAKAFFARMGISILHPKLEEEIFQPKLRVPKSSESPEAIPEKNLATAVEENSIESRETETSEHIELVSPEQRPRAETVAPVDAQEEGAAGEGDSSSSGAGVMTWSGGFAVASRASGYAERLGEREQWGMSQAMKFETMSGRIPKDVSRENRGYDIESTDPAKGNVRYIEVKTSVVRLTQNERLAAERLRDDFYLYVVSQEGESTLIYEVQNPAERCRLDPVATPQWDVANWQGKAKTWRLSSSRSTTG